MLMMPGHAQALYKPLYRIEWLSTSFSFLPVTLFCSFHVLSLYFLTCTFLPYLVRCHLRYRCSIDKSTLAKGIQVFTTVPGSVPIPLIGQGTILWSKV